MTPWRAANHDRVEWLIEQRCEQLGGQLGHVADTDRARIREGVELDEARKNHVASVVIG